MPLNRSCPGMTRDDDLPNIGFDATTGNVDVLSYLDIETRFMPNAAVRFEQLDPSVQACIAPATGAPAMSFIPPYRQQAGGRHHARPSGL